MSLIDTLRALAITVRNEKKKEANSATRIGDLFLAVISFIDGLISGQIRQEGVDTYNDTSEGKTSLLGSYPNPERGWTALVRNDETNESKASLYQWNGSKWVNIETQIYEDDIALKGGSNKTIKELDDEKLAISSLSQTLGEATDIAPSEGAVTDELSKSKERRASELHLRLGFAWSQANGILMEYATTDCIRINVDGSSTLYINGKVRTVQLYSSEPSSGTWLGASAVTYDIDNNVSYCPIPTNATIAGITFNKADNVNYSNTVVYTNITNVIVERLEAVNNILNSHITEINSNIVKHSKQIADSTRYVSISKPPIVDLNARTVKFEKGDYYIYIGVKLFKIVVFEEDYTFSYLSGTAYVYYNIATNTISALSWDNPVPEDVSNYYLIMVLLNGTIIYDGSTLSLDQLKLGLANHKVQIEALQQAINNDFVDFTKLSFFSLGDSSTDGGGSVDRPNVSNGSTWVSRTQSILKFKDIRNGAYWGATWMDYPLGHWNGATELKLYKTDYEGGSSHNVISNQVYSLIRHYRDNKGTSNEFYPNIIFIQAGGNNIPGVYPAEWDTLLGMWDSSFYDFVLTELDYTILDMNVEAESNRYAELRAFRATLFGAMRWAIEALVYWFPNATFFVGSPFPRWSENRQHQYKNLSRMRDEMKRVSDLYGCKFVDGTSNTGLSFFTELNGKNLYTVDGVHQNENGVKLLGDFMANEIKRTYLIKPKV